MPPEEDNVQQDYEDMKVLSFGLMDPCDWAATLSTSLLAATQALATARKNHLDPAKDITDATDALALAAIRAEVCRYLAEVYNMFHSMPMLQQQPQILEAMRFIIAGIADIDRGAAPDWLAVRATKRHPKRLDVEGEWVPIIAALELLLLIGEKPSVDGAAKIVHSRTNRAVGTIKDWHRRLYRDGSQRPAARQAIQDEIDAIRAVITSQPIANRNAIVQRRVDELLA